MASVHWTGGGAAVAQVQSYLFGGTWEATDIVRVTIGSKTYDFVAGSTTIATIIDTIVTDWTALSATVYPEFAEITPTRSTSTLVLTAVTAGKPFTCTITPLETDGTAADAQTIAGVGTATTGTATTASAGPYDVSTAANWSGNAVPTGAISAAPVQANAVAISGGTLVDTTTYYWVVTAINANGETVKSNEKSLTISAPNQTATISWATVVNATGYKIYRSTSAGTYGATSLVTTITSGSTLTYDDTGTALVAGQPPGASTAIGDTVTIDLEGAILRYGLDQSTISLTALTITAKNVEIGLPKINVDGSSYPEYRSDSWKISATTCYVNTKAQRLKLNFGTSQTTYSQDASGNSIETDIPPVLLQGTHASNVFNVFGGTAALCFFAGDTCTAATLRLDAGATVICGSGTTLATVNNNGGTLTLYCAVTTAVNHPGTARAVTRIEGEGAVAQITMQGGQLYYNSTGTLGGNTVLGGSALLTFDEDQRPKAVTNPIGCYSPSVQFSDAYASISGGYQLNFVNCIGTIKLKPNSSVVVAAL